MGWNVCGEDEEREKQFAKTKGRRASSRPRPERASTDRPGLSWSYEGGPCQSESFSLSPGVRAVLPLSWACVWRAYLLRFPPYRVRGIGGNAARVQI